jgi:hypothetical protein
MLGVLKLSSKGLQMQKIKRISLIIFIICFLWLASDHEHTFKSGDVVECKIGSILTKNEYELCKSNVMKTISGSLLFNWNYVNVHFPTESGDGRGSYAILHKNSISFIYRKPSNIPTIYLTLD